MKTSATSGQQQVILHLSDLGDPVDKKFSKNDIYFLVSVRYHGPFTCILILFLISVLKVVQLQSSRGLTEPGDPQRVRERQQQPGGDQALQARMVQLEGQVQHQRAFIAAAK